MEELIYDLETVLFLRYAVTQTFNENKDFEKYISCVYMIDELERKIVESLKLEILS